MLLRIVFEVLDCYIRINYGFTTIVRSSDFVDYHQLVVSPYLLESPRWLLGQDEASAEARRVIKMFRGFRNNSDVELEVSCS